MDVLKTIVETLNSLSPLGLTGGMAYIIFHLVNKKGNVRLISDNHLSGLPEMDDTLRRIEQSLLRQEGLLVTLHSDMNFLKGRLDGRK